MTKTKKLEEEKATFCQKIIYQEIKILWTDANWETLFRVKNKKLKLKGSFCKNSPEAIESFHKNSLLRLRLRFSLTKIRKVLKNPFLN